MRSKSPQQERPEGWACAKPVVWLKAIRSVPIVVRPVGSAPGIPLIRSAFGPVPGVNRHLPQICSATCSGVGPPASGVCWGRHG
jgi:hypothetical protein